VVQAGGKAVKQAAQRTEAALAAASTTARIQQLRRVHWFEKFLWFVTSEGYLVLAGRDAQQNEILVRRCMLPMNCVFLVLSDTFRSSAIV
jgi:predicted ribosome quality control (RQC) complex YloA/Tae2 family protein